MCISIAVLVTCSLVGAEHWSGTIVIDQRLQFPERDAADSEELNHLISEQQRALKVAQLQYDSLPREQRARRKLLAEDIAAFRTNIERAQFTRGGSYDLDPFRYFCRELAVGAHREMHGSMVVSLASRNKLTIDLVGGKIWSSRDPSDKKDWPSISAR